jgi:hypothetical protein
MSVLAAETVVTEQEKGASAHRIAREYFDCGNWHVATFFQNISAMHYERDRMNRGVA